MVELLQRASISVALWDFGSCAPLHAGEHGGNAGRHIQYKGIIFRRAAACALMCREHQVAVYLSIFWIFAPKPAGPLHCCNTSN